MKMRYFFSMCASKNFPSPFFYFFTKLYHFIKFLYRLILTKKILTKFLANQTKKIKS